MKAVEYGWDFGFGLGGFFPWPDHPDAERWICQNIHDDERLVVRMENGQLCVFKRKTQ